MVREPKCSPRKASKLSSLNEIEKKNVWQSRFDLSNVKMCENSANNKINMDSRRALWWPFYESSIISCMPLCYDLCSSLLSKHEYNYWVKEANWRDEWDGSFHYSRSSLSSIEWFFPFAPVSSNGYMITVIVMVCKPQVEFVQESKIEKKLIDIRNTGHIMNRII